MNMIIANNTLAPCSYQHNLFTGAKLNNLAGDHTCQFDA
jgi:hypothetical protein